LSKDSPFQSSSLEENHFLKLAKNEPLDLVAQTKWRLLRTYPGGLRQDSSNADPIQGWNFGVQLAALNYQNEDDMMPLCYGKFLDNGGCGYVLKPDYLIDPHDTTYHPRNSQMNFDNPQTLTITIISGQFLPRSSTGSSDIPDPYVRVTIRGLPCDEQEGHTEVVENNGFNPVWNKKLQFHIKYPQMCLVSFAVIDHDAVSKDDRLAYLCLPMTMIQTGNE
jgi:phosphatidylinositol phospholipase C delta